jgi:hypothetical protein
MIQSLDAFDLSTCPLDNNLNLSLSRVRTEDQFVVVVSDLDTLLT